MDTLGITIPPGSAVGLPGLDNDASVATGRYCGAFPAAGERPASKASGLVYGSCEYKENAR
jgi:hypothetical protein